MGAANSLPAVSRFTSPDTASIGVGRAFEFELQRLSRKAERPAEAGGDVALAARGQAFAPAAVKKGTLPFSASMTLVVPLSGNSE